MALANRFGALSVLVLSCLSACSQAESPSATAAPSVEQIEGAIAMLGDGWKSEPRVPASPEVFSQMCTDVDVLGLFEGSVVEASNENENVGVRQSVASFESSALAHEYVSLWRGSPLACMQTDTVERPLRVDSADEVVRFDAVFPNSTDFSQQLAVVRYDDVVVLIGLSVERETDIDLDGLIRNVAGEDR